MITAFLVLSALADEVGLEIERGRNDLAAEQIEEARRHALIALEGARTNGEAQRLYLDAMVAGGLGPQAVAAIAGLEVDTAPHEGSVDAVRVALEAGEVKAAIAAVRDLQTAWPDRPDLLAVFWEVEPASGSVSRERARLLALVSKALRRDADLLYTYRAHRFFSAAGADLAGVEQALGDLGEAFHTARPVMTRLERSELARVLAQEEHPEIPDTHHADRLDIAERVGRNLSVEGRAADALAFWEAFREGDDSSKAATAHASVLVETEDFVAAVEVADEALALADDPGPRDLAVLDHDALRVRLADAWRVRALALDGQHQSPSALVALVTANAVRGEVVDEVLEERLRLRSVGFANEAKARHRGAHPASTALQAAQKLAEADPAAALKAVEDALFLQSQPLRPNRTDLVTAYHLAARLLVRMDQPDQACVAATAAVLLGGDANAWRLQAELYEATGSTSAAFASWASARARGVDAERSDLEAALQRTYDGPGDWAAAADAVAKKVPDHPEEVAAIRVYTEGLFSLTRRGGTSAQQSARPVVGSKMPAWSVTTARGGTVDSSNLQGRTVVLTFWASYCETCLQMMPELDGLARELRKEGYDVVVVGVSVDTDVDAYERVGRVAQSWGHLVRDPDLAERLGVASLPSTWVVDAYGNVRYFVDSWSGRRAFGRQLRRILVD